MMPLLRALTLACAALVTAPLVLGFKNPCSFAEKGDTDGMSEIKFRRVHIHPLSPGAKIYLMDACRDRILKGLKVKACGGNVGPDIVIRDLEDLVVYRGDSRGWIDMDITQVCDEPAPFGTAGADAPEASVTPLDEADDD